MNQCIVYLFLFLFPVFSSCGQKPHTHGGFTDLSYTGTGSESPSGYDLSHPLIKQLPDYLDEISGISYYDKDSSLFAIMDESGILFKVFLDTNRVDRWKYNGPADYEDIVRVNDVFYALISDGTLVIFSFSGNKPTKPIKIKAPVKKKNDFETLFYHQPSNSLILLCKDCKADKKKYNSYYNFSIAERRFLDEVKQFEARSIDTLAKTKDKFKPSAAAFHPITNDLYIISSVNNLLVIADDSMRVKDAFALDPVVFKQPEGIAFAPNGDMFISNEAADLGPANILLFKYYSNQNK